MRLYKGAQLIGIWFALFSANASVVAQIAIAVDGAPKTIPLVNVGKSVNAAVNAGGNGKDGLFQQSSTNILPGKKVTLTPGRFALLSSSADSPITGDPEAQASQMQSGPPSSTLRADMPPVSAEDSQRARASRVFPAHLNEGASIGPAMRM